jgi:hypothetical protein
MAQCCSIYYYWTTGHGYGTATGFSGSSGGPGVLVVTNKP